MSELTVLFFMPVLFSYKIFKPRRLHAEVCSYEQTPV